MISFLPGHDRLSRGAVAIGLALAMSGCTQSGRVIVTGLAPPAARYLVPPTRLPSTPPRAEMNGFAQRHLAVMRGVCVDRGRTIQGLQSYARTISGAGSTKTGSTKK